MSAACPAADTEVCLCGACVLTRLQRRLRRMAATALREPEGDVAALLYRSTLHGVSGWRASVSTRDGRTYARCWAKQPGDAAQLVIARLSGS